MPRWFNVAGPCNAADHYMLPVMRRLPRIRRLIERKSYFVLHAPRQVGKTTALLARLGADVGADGPGAGTDPGPWPSPIGPATRYERHHGRIGSKLARRRRALAAH